MTNLALTDVVPRLEQHRVELTAHCFRMLGSGFDAEDAAQETLVRAWRSFDGFEGRSSLRAWLYRIATNVCLDLMQGRQRRPLPTDRFTNEREPEATGDHADPADLAESRDAIRVAFIVALRLLPPRQRAVLILREVLRWKAAEVAELLDTSTASVNSSLQRARAALACSEATVDSPGDQDDLSEALLHRYVDAFERFDVDRLVSLLRADGCGGSLPAPIEPESGRIPRRSASTARNGSSAAARTSPSTGCSATSSASGRSHLRARSRSRTGAGSRGPG